METPWPDAALLVLTQFPDRDARAALGARARRIRGSPPASASAHRSIHFITGAARSKLRRKSRWSIKTVATATRRWRRRSAPTIPMNFRKSSLSPLPMDSLPISTGSPPKRRPLTACAAAAPRTAPVRPTGARAGGSSGALPRLALALPLAPSCRRGRPGQAARARAGLRLRRARARRPHGRGALRHGRRLLPLPRQAQVHRRRRGARPPRRCRRARSRTTSSSARSRPTGGWCWSGCRSTRRRPDVR